ncbi:MAG TPA: hypothetical protein DCZ56_05210 [Sutterella sp.]|nr:hypothetical protein [Sutterella sp.]
MNARIGKLLLAIGAAGCLAPAHAQTFEVREEISCVIAPALPPVAPQFVVRERVELQQPDFIFWDQMNSEQRVLLWPLLTPEQRNFHWRYMNKAERAALRSQLTAAERQMMKHRYVIDSAVAALFAKNMPAPIVRMSQGEKDLLRQQVRQAHAETRRGIPYNCTDPTDCPYSAFRMHAADSTASK